MAKYLLSYLHSAGHGRVFGTKSGNELPSQEDIEGWEKILCDNNPKLSTIAINGFYQVSENEDKEDE